MRLLLDLEDDVLRARGRLVAGACEADFGSRFPSGFDDYVDRLCLVSAVSALLRDLELLRRAGIEVFEGKRERFDCKGVADQRGVGGEIPNNTPISVTARS